MNISFITPFVDAASSVGEQYSHKHATRGDLSVMQDLSTKCPVNILAGISGDVEGVVSFGLTRDSAFRFAEAILKQPIRVFDQSVSDALLVLGGKILENCTATFQANGQKLNLTRLTLVRGVSVNIPTDKKPALIVPLHFPGVATIYVKVSVMEKQVPFETPVEEVA